MPTILYPIIMYANRDSCRKHTTHPNLYKTRFILNTEFPSWTYKTWNMSNKEYPIEAYKTWNIPNTDYSSQMYIESKTSKLQNMEHAEHTLPNSNVCKLLRIPKQNTQSNIYKTMVIPNTEFPSQKCKSLLTPNTEYPGQIKWSMNNTEDQDQRENKYVSLWTQVSRHVSVILNLWLLRNVQYMKHTEHRSFQVKRLKTLSNA